MKRCWILVVLLLVLGGCAAPAEEQENFQFTYQGTVIAIDAEAASVIGALGEPKTYTEEASCAFEGLEKTYYYGGFYLSTYPKDGADHVARIWFADDSVSTPEGICIGSSREDVRRAYGEALDDENACIVVRGNSKLTIILEDGVVSSIRYDAMS